MNKTKGYNSLLEDLSLQIPGVIYQFHMHKDGRSSMPYASERLWDVFMLRPEMVKEDASPLFDCVHPDDLSRLKSSILNSFHNLKEWEYECRILHPSGEEKWVRGSAKPSKQQDGSVTWLGYLLDISDKKKNEKVLQETQEKYQTYIEKAPEGFFVLTKTGNITEVNPAACKMTGYLPEELMRMAATDLVDINYKDYGTRILQEAFLRESVEYQLPIRQKHGEPLWISLVSSRLQDDKIIVFCRNINERIETKQMLENQMEFQNVLITISSSFVNNNIFNIQQTVNDALAQCGLFFQADRSYIFMFSDDFALMNNTHEWCKEGVNPQKENFQSFAVASMEWWARKIMEKEVVHIADVNNSWLTQGEKDILLQQDILSLLSIPMLSNGHLIGFLGLDRVTTMRAWNHQQINQFNVIGEIISNALAKNKAEKKLRSSESRYRLLAENAHDMIYRIRLKPEYCFEYVSPSVKYLTGYDPEEFYQDCNMGFKVIYPDDRDYLPEDGGLFEKPLVLRWVRKDGTIFWCEQRNVPIYNNSRELIAMEGIARDVTAQKNVEERLKIVNAELWDKKLALETFNKSLEERIAKEVEKNRTLDHLMALQARQAALGEMIGNIAHQWRQPLNAVSLAIYDLAEAYSHDELNKMYFDNSIGEINRIIQQMSKTIDDFRNYFKPQKEKKLFKLDMIAHSALSFMSAELSSYEINVVQDLSDEACAFGYSNELTQVVVNILKNARDAILEENPHNKKIEIRAYTQNSKSFLEISNTGKSIADADFARLFDPYFTTKPVDKGVGLGLYMAKTIIEKNMNGKIYCDNLKDGVKFTLELNAVMEV